MKLTSVKRHIVPAYFDWLQENDPKVFILFALNTADAFVSPDPPADLLMPLSTIDISGNHVRLTGFTLNVNPEAVHNFAVTETSFFFKCRIRGKACEVNVPFESVIQLSCPDLNLDKQFGIDSEFVLTDGKIAKTIEPEVVVKKNHLQLVK